MSRNRDGIPKTIKIGGLIYEIQYPYVFSEDTEVAGLHEYCQGIIKIANDRPLSKIYETYLHEIIHGIDKVYCSGVCDEKEITALSKGMFCVFMANNLRIKDNSLSSIPKKVNIGGLVYKVVFPHVFQDLENCFSLTSHEQLIIQIGNDKDDPYSVQFVKQNLLFSILHSICTMFNIFEDKKDIFTSLSHGFYQVIYDNNLEELFNSLKKKG